MKNSTMEDLHTLVKKLRAPDGCPWDRKQTTHSMKDFLIEETYEVVSAINDENVEDIEEELGDLLLIISLTTVIVQESSTVSLQSIIKKIIEKVIRRHPHVFASEKAETPEEVKKRWDEIKKEEKKGKNTNVENPGYLNIPASFPEIERSLRMQKKAAKSGFDWDSPTPVLDKIREELKEVEAEMASKLDRSAMEKEVGDLLFSCVNLARKLKIHPAAALHASNEKFQRRYHYIVDKLESKNIPIKQADIDLLDYYWQESKKSE